VHDDVDDTVIRPRAQNVSDVDADTVIRPRAPLPLGVPVGDAEDTVIRSRPAATPAPAVPLVVPPLASDAAPLLAAALPPVPDALAPVAERVASVRITGPHDGERVVRLDRPIVLGRRPALPRVTIGAEPVLVPVGRPHGQVSGSHLAIRSEGQTVVVEDLRSTNGTVVRPPGASGYRLPSGASRVVLTGTLVEIGDGITIEILSPHLRAAPGPLTAPPPTRERSTP
jgi:hypothetical protein